MFVFACGLKRHLDPIFASVDDSSGIGKTRLGDLRNPAEILQLMLKVHLAYATERRQQQQPAADKADGRQSKQ